MCWTYVGVRDGVADGLKDGSSVCPMKLGANEGACDGYDVGENVRTYATPELLPIWRIQNTEYGFSDVHR